MQPRLPATGLLLGLVFSLGCTDSNKKPGGETTETAHPTDTMHGDTGQIPTQRYNIILLVADTLRARSTFVVPGSEHITPKMASWAANHVVFENAISPTGWTPPTIASVLSGLYQSAHGLRSYQATSRLEDDILLDSISTLPELYKEAGYTTTGLYKSTVLPPGRGWEQGFDTWESVRQGEGNDNMARDFAAREMTDAVIAQLEDAGEDPFFIYAHYMDSHTPYQAPEPWYDMYVPDGNTSIHDGTTGLVRDLFDGGTYTTDDVEKLTALYNGEAAYWDSEFIRIPEYLETSGLDENTILVVMGDHGEQFAEHGEWLHAHLWQENIHVPLVMAVPGGTPGRVSQRVSLVDIAPTLSAFTGVAGWDAWQGTDLSAAFSGHTELESRTQYSEYKDRWAVIAADGWKAVGEAHEDYLFNLEVDPLETNNRRHELLDQMDEMRALRAGFVETCQVIRDSLDN